MGLTGASRGSHFLFLEKLGKLRDVCPLSQANRDPDSGIDEAQVELDAQVSGTHV